MEMDKREEEMRLYNSNLEAMRARNKSAQRERKKEEDAREGTKEMRDQVFQLGFIAV
jgi:hypothetical protein